MGKKHRQNDWDGTKAPLRSQGSPEEGQEELSEYIHVTSPGIVVVIVSLLVMLVALIIWGFAGTLPVTQTVTGLVVDTAMYAKIYPKAADVLPGADEGRIVVFCFVDASRYNGQAIKEFGENALIRMPDQKTFQGTVDQEFLSPISMEQAKDILFGNEWVLEQCVAQNYSWWLEVCPAEDLSNYAFTLAQVTILTDEVAPIYFLMK